ncbi:OTU deubiquitinase with linear linkage specificity a [Megalops cyprinoides]|uniref:OTU deubiquitinase with linear linkage specificity a n=1 Tax=Megalops cyprinoides TaxID=118141 RepID=UPI0018644F79|nr:OTU deubiquitinase with linear linkage specificity a [Megalops cyprinoides]
MSWVKAVSLVGEDVFDEDEDDITLQNKEWKCNMEKRVKDGYRDGVDAGKEASLQHGFNAGYREGAAQMVAIGQLKGIVSALQCWCQLQQPDSTMLPSIGRLQQDVAKHEEGLMERMKMKQQQPQASVSEITESIEDLGVEQTSGGGSCSGTDCCPKECAQGEDQPRRPCQRSLHPFFNAKESLEQLLQRCVDLATQLGLPEELLYHVQQLNNA